MRLQLDSTSSSNQTGATQDLQQASEAGVASNARSSGAAVERGGDRTQISSAAGLIATSAAERSTRLAQLTQSVQAGTYNPSSAAVSHAIVSQARP